MLGWLAKVVADRLKPLPHWAVGTSPLWDRLQPVLLNALILCVVIGAYGVFGNPILGLADQGAEALGLR